MLLYTSPFHHALVGGLGALLTFVIIWGFRFLVDLIRNIKSKEAEQNFNEKSRDKKTVLLELGVGFNTPTIIRFPFERMVNGWMNTSLVRINKDNVKSMYSSKRITAIKDDISAVLNAIF